MKTKYAQLFVRIAVATAFLSAVADRLGYYGGPGSAGVSWGNWENFLAYSNTLNFYAPASMGNFLAVSATVLETAFGILLLVGYRTKTSALLAGILLTLFGITMTISLGIKSTFDYSVWVGAGACFLLGTVENYSFSMDDFIGKRRK